MKLIRMTSGEYMEQYGALYDEERLVSFPMDDMEFLDKDCGIEEMAIVNIDGEDMLFEIHEIGA